MSKLQQDWHCRHHALGHNVAVAYATPQGAMILRHPAWLIPIGRESFLERTLTPQQVVEWIVGQIKK